MKKFMKGCAVTAFGFAVVGFVLGLVGGAMAGRSTISQVVDSVTGGRAHIFHKNWWGWDVGIGTDMVLEQADTGMTDEYYGADEYYDPDDEDMFDRGHEILRGDVAKYCPGSSIRNLDIEAGGCQIITELSQDKSVYLEVSDSYMFQGYVSDGTLYIKSTMGSMIDWAERGNCVITLYLPRDFSFAEVEAEIGAGYVSFGQLRAQEASLEAGAGQIDLDGPEIQDLDITVGAGSVNLWNMKVAEMDVEVGMGEFVAEGILDGNADVECSMGSVNLLLTGRERDFNYDIEGAMGNIDIQGESLMGLGQEKSVDNHAGKTISIECSMGYVSVGFTE